MNHQQMWWSGVGCLRELYAMERYIRQCEKDAITWELCRHNIQHMKHLKEMRKRVGRLIELASSYLN